MRNVQVEQIEIQKAGNGGFLAAEDFVAIEEPLAIKLEYSTESGRMQKNVAITMRTPGNDEELAAGFLFTEAVIQNASVIETIKSTGSDENQVLVVLRENCIPDLANATRNFYSSSSCGICGKASIDSIRAVSKFAEETNSDRIHVSVFYELHSELKKQQKAFETTGGIHACALFDREGNFLLLREDVGRHNALDKVIGYSLMQELLPLSNRILLLSGRASFELIQKAVMGGIRIIAAVGAPSSLAVEMAKENDLTLIGFLKDNRFNIYSGAQRVII